MSSSILSIRRLTGLMGLLAIGLVTVSGSLRFSGILHAADPAPVVQSSGAQLFQPGVAPDPSTRMLVMLFDVTAMNAEEMQQAKASVAKSLETIAASDLVSILALSTRLHVLTDFTADRGRASEALASPELDVPAVASRSPLDSEVALRAISTVCRTLASITERKALMYFSAGVAGREPGDQEALNQTTNACRGANVLIYPIDARGLVAVGASAGPLQRQ
jgi:VWFA-related protein